MDRRERRRLRLLNLDPFRCLRATQETPRVTARLAGFHLFSSAFGIRRAVCSSREDADSTPSVCSADRFRFLIQSFGLIRGIAQGHRESKGFPPLSGEPGDIEAIYSGTLKGHVRELIHAKTTRKHSSGFCKGYDSVLHIVLWDNEHLIRLAFRAIRRPRVWPPGGFLSGNVHRTISRAFNPRRGNLARERLSPEGSWHANRVQCEDDPHYP